MIGRRMLTSENPVLTTFSTCSVWGKDTDLIDSSADRTL